MPRARVRNSDEVLRFKLSGVCLPEEPDDLRRVLGVVLRHYMEFIPSTDNDLTETGPYVEINADEKPVVVSDLGIAPVKISIKGVINSGVGEIGEISQNIAGDELRVVVLIETFDESGWQIGVVGRLCLD